MHADPDQYRILVVEDDSLSFKALEYMLEKLGHVLAGRAVSGPQALDLAVLHQPDCILMDIMLEGDMDGIQAAQTLRQRIDSCILFLTGLESLDTMQRAVEVGDCLIQKPVKLTDLAANIEICVRRRRLERQLAATQQRYQAIFQNAPLGVYQSRPDGRLITVNPRLAAMLGHDSPEAMLEQVRDPDTQIYAAEGRREEFLRAMREQGEVRHFESEIYGRDGDALWIQEEARLVRDEHGREFYEGFVLDITDRKDAEASRDLTLNLLRQTLDALTDVLVVVDADQRIILANARLCAVARAECEDSLAGEALPQYLAPESRRAWNAVFERFMRDGRPRQVRVAFAAIDAGDTVSPSNLDWHIVSISPYRAPDGDLIGAVCLARRAGIALLQDFRPAT